MTNGKEIEMTEKEQTALKWAIGIISFIIWVAVGRGLIFGGDATDASAGQQWAMLIWTVVVIVAAIKIYSAIVKE
jgi:hypothetical protein